MTPQGWNYLLTVSLMGLMLGALAWAAFLAWAPVVVNFRGDQMRTGYGVFLTAAAAAAGGASWVSMVLPRYVAAAWLVVVLTFGILGFYDDVRGRHGGGGFRGHFGRMLRERKISSGVLKAVGGIAASVLGAWMIRPAAPIVQILVDGAVIALMANLLNLLDLRPGRAGWSYLVLWLAATFLPEDRHILWLSTPLTFALAVMLPADSRGRWIMGDAGSNVLGAAIGFTLVLHTPPAVRLGVLAVLLAVHVVAEKYSLTRMIQRNRVLSYLDRLTGIRK